MSFTGPHPDIEIPDQSVFDFLFSDLDADDLARIALVDGWTGEQMTYGELVTSAHGIAAGLCAAGLACGDVVAVCAPNCPAYAAVYYGALRLGAVVSTVDTTCAVSAIASQLVSCGARLVFTIGELAERAVRSVIAAGMPASSVIILDSGGVDGMDSPLSAFIAAAVTAASSDLPEPVFDPGTHLAVLPYSSHRTGEARGIMLTHTNLVANLCQFGPHLRLDRYDRILAVMPFSGVFGLSILLNAALAQRAMIVTMPRYELSRFLRTASDYECTYLFVEPPVAAVLAQHALLDEYDLSSVHTLVSGGAALDPSVGEVIAERIGCRVRQGYGISEMGAISHLYPIDQEGVTLGSVGFAVANMVCKIVDTCSGKEIEPPAHGVSSPGELCCRGPNVMVGYMRNAEATVKALDSDGYLHTGDIATVDHLGTVTIVGHMKDASDDNGYRVAPWRHPRSPQIPHGLWPSQA